MYYPRSAYNGNPHAGVDVNSDNGWGGYQWPGGVPRELLAESRSGDVAITARRELTELFGCLVQICEQKHGYKVHGDQTWSYENRPIAGTQTPSNHSRGRAVDINAPQNPYSSTWQCDMPPAMVADLESLGFYWGGRYVDQPTDPMHYEYWQPPCDVAASVARARSILAGVITTDWLDAVCYTDFIAAAKEALR